MNRKIIKKIFDKLGDKYLEDSDWVVNPILDCVLGNPPRDIDEESVYELAREIKEFLKQRIKGIKL